LVSIIRKTSTAPIFLNVGVPIHVSSPRFYCCHSVGVRLLRIAIDKPSPSAGCFVTVHPAITTILVANLLIVAVAVLLGLMTNGKPSRYFGEGRFTTAISCVQLLAVAFFSIRMFLKRRSVTPKGRPMSGAGVWALIAMGFVFLAADEVFQIHERLDDMIHGALALRETPWTDRLDDAIIALYGTIGVAVLWLFRNEISSFREIRRPLWGGFFCLSLSVICDTVSNEDHFLVWLCGNVVTANQLNAWVSVGDGACTLLGEGFFLAAFYLSHQTAFSDAGGGLPGIPTLKPNCPRRNKQ
jgi:hypothetical protein